MKFAKLMMVGFLSLSGALAQANSCSLLFSSALSELASWNQSVEAIRQIRSKVYGIDEVVEAITVAILAKEFAWINGEPGGAKTFLSRIGFEAALNSISNAEKKTFIIQFHKLITEGKITGFQKFHSMMEEGKYKIETQSSLVNDKFIFLIADEAEKANPATLNSLLSILNERKAFSGARVIEAGLLSGVFTSNKTTGEFVNGSVTDRQAGEALLDRMAIKIHALNQQVDATATVAMINLVKNATKEKIALPVLELQKLVAKVKIPDDMVFEISKISRAFDRYVTDKWGKSKYDVRWGQAETEYFPANQFSNRSMGRLVQVFKASLITRQLMEGTLLEHIRLTPRREDLALLVQGAAYGGPASIRFKRFMLTEEGKGAEVASPYKTRVQMAVSYSPFEERMFIQNSGGVKMILGKENNQWQIVATLDPGFIDWTIEQSEIEKLLVLAEKVVKDNNIDKSRPKFEVETQIDKFIKKGTLKERTELELTSIKKDIEQFALVLDQHFDTDPVPFNGKKVDYLPVRSEKEIRKFRRQVYAADKEERLRRYWEWMAYEIKAIRQRFVEMDHSIEAHLTAMLSDTHLFVFGPPGGAKTALAEALVKAEIKNLNSKKIDEFVKGLLKSISKDQNYLQAVLAKMRQENPKLVKRFLLQFHPLIPEGVLLGFPKVKKLLDEGIEEKEFSTSMANQIFVFSILDEIDKANPQTGAALLSLLQEREVLDGDSVFKTALRTAISTSNKVPSEFLDSAGNNRPQNEALLDRHVNKVFVSNKISSEEELTQFLINLEKGISTSWKGLLGISELQPLLKEVTFEDALEDVMARVHEKFSAVRNAREKETRKMAKNSKEFPDYYVMASSSVSGRSTIAYFELIKARFLIHQLISGVPFKELRTKIEFKDLGLFFEGMAYWAPQKIGFTYDKDGILEFTRNTEILDRLIASGVIDTRVKYHLDMMLEESRDYVNVINDVVKGYLIEYKTMISQYPDLFPSLFFDKEIRDAHK